MRQVVQFLAQSRPRSACLENVRGIMQTDRNKGDEVSAAQLLKTDLQKLDYEVAVVEVDLQHWHNVVRQRIMSALQPANQDSSGGLSCTQRPWAQTLHLVRVSVVTPQTTVTKIVTRLDTLHFLPLGTLADIVLAALAS